MAEANVRSIREYEKLARIENVDYESWVDTGEKEEIKKHFRDSVKSTVNQQIPWLDDVYFDVPPFDKKSMKRAFKLSNVFYHWKEFTMALRMYVQWYIHLEKESKINNEIDEGVLLRKVWDNMIEQGEDFIYTDGGSVINAYYVNSWIYLYNYYDWAEDENFDFAQQMFETVQSVFLKNFYVNWISDTYFTRSQLTAGDMITHSPLHYNRHFESHKKHTRKYFWLRWISFFTFFYVLFFLPGEYVLNYHLLTIPFGVWVTTTILYRHFKNYNKIIDSNGAYFYKLSWRKHNPFWESEIETTFYLRYYKSTFTRDPRYLWEDWFLGSILWIFTGSWYILDWYETEAWRHRWFPWDISKGGVSLNDVIHDDGFDRNCSGKNHFSLPYANTFRERAGWDFLPLDGPLNHQIHKWDMLVCNNREFPLNKFVEKSTFYVKFFLCSDKMRYRHPLSDITRDRVTPMEFTDFINLKIKNLTHEKTSAKQWYKWAKNEDADILFTDGEYGLFLYTYLKDFRDWFKDLFINRELYFQKIKLQLEQLVVSIKSKSNDYFSLDMRDRMDVFDYYYFHLSCYIHKYFLEYYEYIFEFIKSLF